MLEPYEGKLSRTVLRGEGGSNALDLPDTYISYIPEVYYKKKDLHYMLSRQNKREALVTILFSATPILSAVFQPIK